MTQLGDDWHGWEFWYVCTEHHIAPAQMASSWSPDEVFEAYYYLRLKYLTTAPGGV